MKQVSHKEEALKVLTTARKMLEGEEPIVALMRVQLRALLEYAEQEILRIQAVKRVRHDAAHP